MKKSPLSTPGGNRGHFYRGRGRGRNRGYGYNQMNHNNDNYQRFSGVNNSPNDQLDGDMIPLDSSSPIYHNRSNRRPLPSGRDQRFSTTGITGSYNDQRNNFQGSPNSPYSPMKYQQRNQQPQQQQYQVRQKNDSCWHRKLPITEFIDIKTAFEDPWKDLMDKFEESQSKNVVSSKSVDSSIEIIFDKNEHDDSSSDNTHETTINISSSCDESKENSSVDLPLENMNFNQDSKDVSALSDSIASQSELSFSEDVNQSQNDSSVVEIIY